MKKHSLFLYEIFTASIKMSTKITYVRNTICHCLENRFRDMKYNETGFSCRYVKFKGTTELKVTLLTRV